MRRPLISTSDKWYGYSCVRVRVCACACVIIDMSMVRLVS